MKAHEPSRTAEYVAAFRALETVRRPAPGRLFEDVWASAFLGAVTRRYVRWASLPLIGGMVRSWIEWRSRGAMSSGIARTRLIDDWLDEAVVQGIRQIVLLGAGYDCRASRLAGLADCRILEIDHPATQAHKKACLQTLDRSMPDNVDYLAADLTERNPDTVWECAGLEKNTPVFVLWEGVTHYLGEEAVNATLRVLSRVCARGSLLVFTYLDRALLDGSRVFPGASIARKRVALGNEPWIWGMDPVMLPHYLSERGFELVEDLEADAYRALYWGDAAKRLKGFGFYHVALARTKDQA